MDWSKALQLYLMAADQGSHWGQQNYANMLRVEIEESPNHAEALQKAAESFRYYKLAAEQGLTEAELNVGLCYAKGDGVSEDVNEAKRWFVRAAAKGQEDAIDVLREWQEIDRGQRDHLPSPS